MNEMKTIYHVEGKLCKEFVGQMSLSAVFIGSLVPVICILHKQMLLMDVSLNQRLRGY